MILCQNGHAKKKWIDVATRQLIRNNVIELCDKIGLFNRYLDKTKDMIRKLWLVMVGYYMALKTRMFHLLIFHMFFINPQNM